MKFIKTLGKIVLGIVAGLAIVFGLFYLLTSGDYHVAETVAQDTSIPHIEIDGVTYHAETFGDPENPVVVTVHGGPGGDYRSILSL
jgi:proline iminopeptidase